MRVREVAVTIKKRTEKTRFEIKDTKEPVLYRDMFPYTSVPRVELEERLIPINMPDEIWMTDTTFRDGQQSRPPYTAKQIVEIFDFLHRLSGPKGVIRQSEFFLYSPKDKEAVRLCMERGYRFPEITGWIRANKEDFKLVKEMGLKETGILTSCSDYHIFLKLNKTRKDAHKAYLDIVATALEQGITPRCHLEDITRADFYGFVIPFVQDLMKLSEAAKIPVKIRACDTMGYGFPFPGTALPRGVPEIFYALHHEGGVPSAQLEWHGHNDFHKVLVNGVAAWLYGCSSVNGALLGFGERTGNTPIEALLMDYISLTGDSEGIDTQAITEMAEYFRKELEFDIPANYPFVGSEFNSTSAGIHADGMMKNEEIYNIFDTTKILKRPMGVIITDKSGIAGIAHWVNSHITSSNNLKVDKRHPGLAKMHTWVMALYEQGRTTSISNDELYEKAKKHLPEYFVSDLDRLKKKASEVVRHIVENFIELPEMRSMDPAQQESVMQKLQREDPYIQFAYVVNGDGIKITKNVTDIQNKSKYEISGLGDNFSDRSWFIQPMKTGSSFVSDFYTSRITGALCITVSAPIRDKQEEVAGVFGVDIRFEDLVKAED
ncbi:MAG: histone-lysine N-methyltransferase [Nitrospirae bacterium GWC2_57_13]|nr:MAG: histone-lysine N-methyltransferase [Nitrospirae bacterium GWC2_57_13]